MRVWLHTSVRSATVTQSTIFSLVTHVALVGAAVYGTGAASRQLLDDIAERVYYLPPPDRRPNSEARVEHLTYVDVGNGAALRGAYHPGGEAPPSNGREAARDPGAITGKDEIFQTPSLEFASPDSVYSILDVDESAVRSVGSAAPIYPPEMIKNRVEGGVFLRFVIDTTGRADPTSIEVVRSSHPAFTDAVRTAVPLMAFTPASVQGRRVRQAVEQNFEFKIAPSVAAASEHTRTKPVP